MKTFVTLLFLSASIFATDYSSMSIDELANLRGSVASEDRDAFKSAWQEKTQYLSPDEQMAYKRGGNSENSNATQTQQRLKDGSGSGGMYKGSKGHGGGGR
ncbi:MAG: hypothetical protein JXQ66_05045 [Campylobacterales bacterium]|nr:hypothetical protein [Campylobacterales bacterium]